jgi:hypothetical protein
MQTQTQIIPEALFRGMVKDMLFADMIRLEAFNNGKKPHIFFYVTIGAFLMPLAFLMSDLFWAGMWLVFCLLVVGLGTIIGQKENRRFRWFRLMCANVFQLECLFGIDRHDDPKRILEAVQKKLADLALEVIKLQTASASSEGAKQLFGDHFQVAKAVLRNRLDSGRGHGPFYDLAKKFRQV